MAYLKIMFTLSQILTQLQNGAHITIQNHMIQETVKPILIDQNLQQNALIAMKTIL